MTRRDSRLDPSERISRMDTSTAVLAELLAMVKRRGAKKAVRDKVVVQECIQCKSPAIIGCRGLCRFHHGQFKHARAEAAKNVTITKKEEREGKTLEQKVEDAKKEFDRMQVEAGRILDSRQGKHGKPSPFTVDVRNPFTATA